MPGEQVCNDRIGRSARSRLSYFTAVAGNTVCRGTRIETQMGKEKIGKGGDKDNKVH